MEQACRRGISGVVERADPFISILSSPGCRRSRRATSIPVVYTLHFALHATKAVRKLTTRRSFFFFLFFFFILCSGREACLISFLLVLRKFADSCNYIVWFIVNKKVFWESMKKNSWRFYYTNWLIINIIYVKMYIFIIYMLFY